MNFKAYFINAESNDQTWNKLSNLLSLLPKEMQESFERFEPVDIGQDFDSVKDFGLDLSPVGLINELYLSFNPDQINRYLTHYSIYKKIIDEEIDSAMIFEDETVISDILNLLICNPDLNPDLDLINLSVDGIEKFNAYYITNTGAKNILDLLDNLTWMNGVKRFSSEDYGLPKEYDLYTEFTSEPLQDFSKKKSIVAPINLIIYTACQFRKLSFLNNIQFVWSVDYYRTFKIKNDLKDLTQDKLSFFTKSKNLNTLNNSIIDCIFYINLDEDIEKMNRMESMLEQTNIPFERFPAIKPTLEDTVYKGKYADLFSKSKLLATKEFFDEEFDNIDLEQFQLGTLGCYLSHRELLKSIESVYEHKNSRESFMRYILVLEDDCFFNFDTIEDLNKTIYNLPNDWDILRSTWTAPESLEKINYCHPMSCGYDVHTNKAIFDKIKTIYKHNPSVCPIAHTFSGGTHFQAINVKSIPKILDYLESQPFLPIDALYTTDKLNVYNKKMKVSHDIFKNSSINKIK